MKFKAHICNSKVDSLLPKLKIFYTNADQFLNKRDDLLVSIIHDQPDIILITEVIPKAQSSPITLARLTLPNYSCYLNFDPEINNLGSAGLCGICIYISSLLNSSEVKFSESNFKEQLWINIKLRGSDSLLVGCLYRSPSSDPSQSTLELSNLLQLVSNKSSHLLICGDFNYCDINWSDPTLPSSCTHHSQMFLDALHDLYLYQHIFQPTRYRSNAVPHTLDLVLSNEEGMVDDIQYLPGLGNSDHVCVFFNFVCYLEVTNYKIPKYNIHRADYDKMNNLLAEIEWAEVLSPLM